MTTPSNRTSFFATGRGKLTLALLCAVAFLDFVDASIVNGEHVSTGEALTEGFQDALLAASLFLVGPPRSR